MTKKLVESPHHDKNIAFIDIGTNSIRLLLENLAANGAHTTLSVQKETVRLGEGEFFDGYLQEEAMARAINVCKQFAEMARANNAEEIITVATSATREARNRDYFIDRLKQEAGLDVQTISSIEEARLIYLGIINGYDLKDKTALMIDIGGGSTELILGNANDYLSLNSMKLGAVRLGTMFFSPDETGPVSDEKYALLKRFVQNSAIRAIQNVREKGKFDLVIGSSGTIENLADICCQLYLGRPRLPDDKIPIKQLRKVVDHLRKLPLEERAKVPGINPRRADIIVAGASIILTIFEELGVKEFEVTNYSLRDGLLVEYLKKSGYADLFEDTSVRYRSVQQLAKKCNIDEAHAQNVRRLAIDLFRTSKKIGLHKLPGKYRELLEYGTILHDIGILLSYTKHQEHSYYLIKNSDLVGFTQRETDFLAALAFFHRKKFPKNSRKQLYGLTKKEKEAVRICSLFLRMSESLDRSHKGIVQKVRFSRKKDGKLGLTVYANEEPQLEIWGVENHKKMFERVFGIPYEIIFKKNKEEDEVEVSEITPI